MCRICGLANNAMIGSLLSRNSQALLPSSPAKGFASAFSRSRTPSIRSTVVSAVVPESVEGVIPTLNNISASGDWRGRPERARSIMARAVEEEGEV